MAKGSDGEERFDSVCQCRAWRVIALRHCVAIVINRKYGRAALMKTKNEPGVSDSERVWADAGRKNATEADSL